jgi:hypothetical protein
MRTTASLFGEDSLVTPPPGVTSIRQESLGFG